MSKKSNRALLDAEEGLPRLEDIVGSANWDDRLADAKTKRDRVVAKEKSGPLNKPEKLKQPKEAHDTSPDKKLNKDIVSLEEVLATGNLNDRLEMAIRRRKQVMAQRSQNGQHPSPLPGKAATSYKDTVRVAVSGSAAAIEPEVADVPDTPVTPVAPVAPVVVLQKKPPKRKRHIGYIAAGIVIAWGVGFLVQSPLRDLIATKSITPVALIPDPETLTAQSTPASQTADTEVSELDAGASESLETNPVGEITDLAAVAPPSLPQPSLPQPTATITVASLDAADISARPPSLGVQIDASLSDAAPGALPLPLVQETAPNIATESFSANLVPASATVLDENQTTAANSSASNVLSVPPEFSTSVTALQSNAQITQPTPALLYKASFGPRTNRAMPETLAAETSAFGNDRRLARLDNALDDELLASEPLADRFRPETMDSIAFELSLAQNQSVDGQINELFSGDDSWIKPTKVTFLSGPTDYEKPVAPNSIERFEVAPVSAAVLAAVLPDAGEVSDIRVPQSPAASIQVASVGIISPAELPDVPEVSLEIPETYEFMLEKSNQSGLVTAMISGDGGAILDAAGFSIHVRAQSNLPEEKLAAFADALRETGFSVNEPKRVDFNISKNNIRFFHESDAKAARILAAAVGGLARDFTDYSPSPPVGTIEVWLAGTKTAAKPRKRRNRAATEDPALSALRNRLINSLRRGDHL